MVKQQVRAIARAFQRGGLQNWLLLVVSAAVLVIVLAAPGSALTPKDVMSASDKDFTRGLEVAKVVISAVGTIATMAAGWVLYLNFRVANKNAKTAIKTWKVANRNAAAANKTVKLTESRLVTERFSKAVEQLGNDKIEVRLGGIYALERIALDSVRDHWTIMEVLTAFVREKSPHVNRSFIEHVSQADVPKDKPALVTKDVQAVLTVIGRRKVEHNPEGKRLDLSSSNLRDADLEGANLTDANLYDTDLRYADLCRAILYKANLSRADLKGANLEDASLEGASLWGADLKGANLTGADLSSADLSRADLNGADFIDVRGITPNQIKQAKNWQKAHYSPDFCQQLGLPPALPSPSPSQP